MNIWNILLIWVVGSIVLSPFLGRVMGFNDHLPARPTIPPRPSA